MKPSGSSIILLAMYATWIGYIFLYTYVKATYGISLPDSITYGCAALFISETGALLAIRLKKEGFSVPTNTMNTFLTKIGLGTKDALNTFADSFQPEAKHAKEENDGKAEK